MSTTVWLSSCSIQKRSSRKNNVEVNSLRFDIVQDARKTVGAGYRYGATGNKRYDCSGLVYALFTNHDISLPRSTSEMSRFGTKIKKDDLLPGDLIFFKHAGKIDHVAIVSRLAPAKTWLIHSTTSRGVIEEILEDSPYWTSRIVRYQRYLP